MTPKQLAEFKAIKKIHFRGTTWKLKVYGKDPERNDSWGSCDHHHKIIRLYCEDADAHTATRVLLHELMHMSLLAHDAMYGAFQEGKKTASWLDFLEEFFVDLASWGILEVFTLNPKIKKLFMKYSKVDPDNPVVGTSKNSPYNKSEEKDDARPRKRKRATRRAKTRRGR